ncbi:MAG TPA: DegT/DnrJ/EryC1/StrS family aminotransferase [Arenimonas sp.]|uniref:DegT/DnrJ/EryC1/StrS family aminotransferase n=1 Tax=Arenimonas sp. TaxID=1872635 RepID=UPI002D7FC473|nr:DegT/DnrJ/EryC1/StrS family aminotransferase [Arenimonas sp.]HEU0152055.1 DegT/DnrJ/EryC1/StrS family aminotransferase [Arenimonas sp.]
MSSRILYTKPSITDLEVEYATDAARNGWGALCYDYIYKLEAKFAAYVGTEFAIATSSCTGALHMGMSAIGIGPGDEVILADTNWIAAASVIVHLGATPVFVDILPDSWCIDPDKARAAITPRTKAIIATHLYGNLCDMDALLDIGRQHDLPIIEDAAEALGSAWGARQAGSRGLFGTFSFHGTKTMTTGEGGMFVTSDAALNHKVLTLNNHGRVPGETHQFWSQVVGFKYKMSNIQAAIGCAQIERIEDLIGRKREIFAKYRVALAPISAISINPEPAGTINSAWMPTAVFARETGVTRELLLAEFKSANVDARVFFHPLSTMPMFTHMPGNVVGHDIADRAINLPSYHDMTDDDISRVVSVLKGCLDKAPAGGTHD